MLSFYLKGVERERWWVGSFLLLLRFFSVFGKIHSRVSQCWALWIHLTWSLLRLLDVYMHVLDHIWEISCHCFLDRLLAPASLFSSWERWCPRAPWVLFTSLTIFSSFSSDLIVSIVLSLCLLIVSSVWSNLPLNSCSEYSVSFIVLFSYRISFIPS